MYQEISIVKKEPAPTKSSISIFSITIVLCSRNIVVNWTWKVRAIHSERRGDYGEDGLGRKLAANYPEDLSISGRISSIGTILREKVPQVLLSDPPTE